MAHGNWRQKVDINNYENPFASSEREIGQMDVEIKEEELLRETIRRILLTEALKFGQLSDTILLKTEEPGFTYYVLLHKSLIGEIGTLFQDNFVAEWEQEKGAVIDKVIKRFSNKALGMIGVSHVAGSIFDRELKLFAATAGWGPTLHDIVMGEANGIIADREEVSRAAYETYHFYNKNRPDIKKRPLDSYPHKWTQDPEDDIHAWGSSGDYADIGGRDIYDNTITHEEFLKDPLNWAYYGNVVPEAAQAYANVALIEKELESLVEEPKEILKMLTAELAEAFFHSTLHASRR